MRQGKSKTVVQWNPWSAAALRFIERKPTGISIVSVPGWDRARIDLLLDLGDSVLTHSIMAEWTRQHPFMTPSMSGHRAALRECIANCKKAGIQLYWTYSSDPRKVIILPERIEAGNIH